MHTVSMCNATYVDQILALTSGGIISQVPDEGENQNWNIGQVYDLSNLTSLIELSRIGNNQLELYNAESQ